MGLYDGFQNRETQLVFGDPTDTKKQTIIPIDCSLSISTSMSAQVTNFPIEEGSITDHIQQAPLMVTIEGFISESPSQKLLTLANAAVTQSLLSTGRFSGLSASFAAAATATLTSYALSNSQKFDKAATFKQLLSQRSEVDPEYPKRAMLGLERMFYSGELFTIRTFFSDVIYTNMAAISLSFNQTAEIGDSLSFTLTAQKVNVVQRLDPIPVEIKMADPAGSSAAEEVKKGTKTKKEVPQRSPLLQKSIDDGLLPEEQVLPPL